MLKLSADDPVQLFIVERPQYAALVDATGQVWRRVRESMAALRRDWFAAAGLEDPGPDPPMRALPPEGQKAPLTREQATALDRAISRFLRDMAGDDRTEQGFVRDDLEDGLLQQAEFLSYQVGVSRGLTITGMATNPAFTDAIRQSLLQDAFARLTQDGQFRFELRLGEIRDAMVDGLEAGANPLAVARDLSQGLSGYEAGRMRTIVRTETGIASERGIRAMYQQAGIAEVEVIGTVSGWPCSCPLHIGRTYRMSDTANLPLYHPNCYCSVIPKGYSEEE